MFKKQEGFTAVELVIALGGLASLAVLGGVIYVACHFIGKFW